jgi:hypothetical protein
MAVQVPHYSTLVIFGKESHRSVRCPALFQELVAALVDVLAHSGCPLKCRGTIENESGKNIAPRKGTLSKKKLEEWCDRLHAGVFFDIELFDAAWSDTVFPAGYAAIHKMWTYTREGYIERTDVRAENNVTIALAKEAVPGGAGILEEVARPLAEMISAFYGFLEADIEWDVDDGYGLRERLMDLRWYDCTRLDYPGGRYKMTARVARVYYGNIVSKRHVKEKELGALPRALVARLENWPGGLRYVRFTRDPQADQELHETVARAFNLVG